MTDQLNDEQVAQFQEAFNIFDQDHDGAITSKELGTVMRQLGEKPNEGQLRSMIKKVDTDGNGKVEFAEFLKLMTQKLNSEKDEVRTVFRQFDEDGDGFITAKELKRKMKTLGETLSSEQLEDMIKEADKDNDGKVNFQEFCTLWSELQQ